MTSRSTGIPTVSPLNKHLFPDYFWANHYQFLTTKDATVLVTCRTFLKPILGTICSYLTSCTSTPVVSLLWLPVLVKNPVCNLHGACSYLECIEPCNLPSVETAPKLRVHGVSEQKL
eukprot:5171043-Amphidinium_carterae.2